MHAVLYRLYSLLLSTRSVIAIRDYPPQHPTPSVDSTTKLDTQVFRSYKKETHHAKRALVSVPCYRSVCSPVLSSLSML